MIEIVFKDSKGGETFILAETLVRIEAEPRSLMMHLVDRFGDHTEIVFDDEPQMDYAMQFMSLAFRKDLNQRYEFQCEEIR